MIKSRTVHRICAVILALFILSHLAVHLTAVRSAEAHNYALNAVQWIYRNPIGETLLVLAILTQIVSGWRRLKFKRRSKNIWARLQVYSGLYLIFFLIIHTSAALFTHHIFGIETDFHWAAGSLHFTPLKYGFALYYFLAVMSVFVHWSCALHFGWRGRWPVIKMGLPVVGAIIAVFILAAFWGAFYSIIIPDDVTAYYAKYFPGID